MTTLNLNDLNLSQALDRKAMTELTGGAEWHLRSSFISTGSWSGYTADLQPVHRPDLPRRLPEPPDVRRLEAHPHPDRVQLLGSFRPRLSLTAHRKRRLARASAFSVAVGKEQGLPNDPNR